MKRPGLTAIGALVVGLVLLPAPRASAADSLRDLQTAFERYSGAKLVFDADALPAGQYHDVMPSLTADGQRRAAEIAVREVRKLPRGYLGAIGLKAVGIFRACASRQDDGYHPYDEQLKAYRYYGIWNGHNALAAAFYSERQLPLTLQHEIFHHVDGTLRGKTDFSAHALRDKRFDDIRSGTKVYAAARLSAEDRAALQKRSGGAVLERVVSDYAAKSPTEDKAETARYLMSDLPDALVQVASRPELPGSQRLLHVLAKYEQALPENGPGLDWFVGVALDRPRPEAKPAPVAKPATPADLAARLRALAARGGDLPDDEARELLRRAEAAAEAGRAEAAPLAKPAADVTLQLLRQRLQPRGGDKVFTVWGKEDAQGVNQTLRADLAAFGSDARRLGHIVSVGGGEEATVAPQLQELRLLARYYRFIASQWAVSGETRRLFELARDDMTAALPRAQSALLRKATDLDWEALANRITAEGKLAPTRPKDDKAEPGSVDPYLAKVDAEVSKPAVRTAIRRVQPACVRLNGASGVNLTADGYVLTAAHVVDRLGAKVVAEFPDGRKFAATCVGFSAHLDLAVCKLADAADLPSAPLAPEPPEVGTRVVCIGQPGKYTPEGKATGYQPFHVSAGSIRGFVDDLLGDQSLGRVKHDAWTYWGHSGSPIFNESGALVALHNSWDSSTAMRRAVPYQAIVHFLKKEKVRYRTAE